MDNHTRIEHQKRVVDNLLAQLFPVDPYAICAGGAPRDWYFGVPASDLDIFFYTPLHSTGMIEDVLHSVGIVPEDRQSASGLPDIYKKNPKLRCVYNFTVAGEKVQLMLMTEETFRSVLPEFPLSICKVWYKNGKTTPDKEFLRSVKHGVVVLTNKLYNDGDKYVGKVLQKFPAYKYFTSWDMASKYIMDK